MILYEDCNCTTSLCVLPKYRTDYLEGSLFFVSFSPISRNTIEKFNKLLPPEVTKQDKISFQKRIVFVYIAIGAIL